METLAQMVHPLVVAWLIDQLISKSVPGRDHHQSNEQRLFVEASTTADPFGEVGKDANQAWPT